MRIDPDWLEPAAEALPLPAQAHELDFWIGEWEVTWEGGSARNTIRPILGHRAILETFDGARDAGLRGTSVSAFDAAHGRWAQLWADNQGSVFDLRGGRRGEEFEMRTDPDREGGLRRMRFSQITPDGLLWEWSRGAAGSQRFEVLWSLRYRRLV